MKKIYDILTILPILLIAVLFFDSCETGDPFPDPEAEFTIWGVNPESGSFEMMNEPYELIAGQTYDFRIEGTGQQFVIWFGVPGDPASDSPTGSDFNDRGINHVSKGKVASNNLIRYTYSAAGTYEAVLVASSYSYSENECKESLFRKTIEVVAAP